MNKSVKLGNFLVVEGIRCWYSMHHEARGEGDEPKYISRDQIMGDFYEERIKYCQP